MIDISCYLLDRKRQAPRPLRIGAPAVTDQRTPTGLERQILNRLLDRLSLVLRAFARA
jgi:hypothetical protein